MIENKFIKENLQAFEVKEYIYKKLKKVGLSDVKMQKTPLGERIIIRTSRPGLVVGRGGSNIQALTKELKQLFKLENPQIEIEEVKDYRLDPGIMAEMVANSLERYGTKGFKGIAHRAVQDVMKAGARGVEVVISGLVPSQRAKRWRFRAGYMKKSGEIAIEGVKKALRVAQLKRCVIGVQVAILPPEIRIPDEVFIKEQVPPQDSAASTTNVESKNVNSDELQKDTMQEIIEKNREEKEVDNKNNVSQEEGQLKRNQENSKKDNSDEANTEGKNGEKDRGKGKGKNKSVASIKSGKGEKAEKKSGGRRKKGDKK